MQSQRRCFLMLVTASGGFTPNMEQDEIAEARKAARRWSDAGVVRLAA